MADDLRNCVENLDAMGLLCEVSTQCASENCSATAHVSKEQVGSRGPENPQEKSDQPNYQAIDDLHG